MITTVVLPVLVILALVLVNAVFVAAEFALVGARRSRLQTLADRGSRIARWLVDVFDRPTGKDAYIAVAQLGITLASIGLGMYGEPAVAKWLYGPFEDWGLSESAAHTVGFVVALSGITYLHVVFGEMIPKGLALQSPEQVSIKVNPVMRVFGLLFRPMVHLLNTIALGLLRLLRIPEPDRRLALYTSAELEIVTDEAADSGQLGAMQRGLIHNIFDLDERTAEELMTPRAQMEVVDRATPVDDVIEQIDRSPRSRYPVVDGDLDHVIGMLHAKDVMRAAQVGSPPPVDELVRHLPTVAATASAERLLERFKREQTHAILVVDEFGGTVGLVTLDDLIAEVMDEQIEDRAGQVVHHDDGSLSVDGGVTLADLRDDHGVDLVHPEVTTVAGLVLAHLGTIPDVGATVDTGAAYDLVVESVDGRRVSRIRIRPHAR
ncbi:MAG: HlyC/CorC family transporter [Acidimicrobiales bacterium]|nr:HlyC/CorC family transporter [Acidimicrobiales bacterium]